MSYSELNDIYGWFQTGKTPTELQFQKTFSSFYHKSEQIPITAVTGLNALFQQTATLAALNNHLNDSNAHAGYLAKLDATNLNASEVNAWRLRLGVGDIPDNVALVDVGANQSVYNKQQIDTLCLLLSDYVINGKLRADKIEALGLTELISVTQTSLSAFIANNTNYTYEKNDIIAVPDGTGNYSLYIYKGGSKTVSANYLPTGLTNITISMVQGLQSALDAKVDKPTAAGNYMARYALGAFSWKAINPASSYLTFWNGNDFAASGIYTDGTKFGIATTTPSEMLHLNNGRIRTKAIVLDDNSETLLNQLTTVNRKLYFTDNTGAKKQALMKEDLLTELLAAPSAMTDAQKTQFKTDLNGGFTTNTMSVADIFPPVSQYNNTNQFFTIRGANLNFNPANFSVKICSSASTALNPVILATIPNNQISLLSATDIAFYYNFYTLGQGTYKLLLSNGVADYLTPQTFQITTSLAMIDVGALTWNKKVLNDATTSVMNASGAGMTFRPDAAVRPLAAESISLFKAKTAQPLFNAGDNFYLEMLVSTYNLGGAEGSGKQVFGLSTSAGVNGLMNDFSPSIDIVNYGTSGAYNYFGMTQFTGFYIANSSQSMKFIFIKRGTSLVILGYFIIMNNSVQSFFQLSGTISNTNDFYFGGVFQNQSYANSGLEVTIGTAYKF